MSEVETEAPPTLGRDALAEYGAELALACSEEMGKQLERPLEVELLEITALPAHAVVEVESALVDLLFLGDGKPPAIVHAVLPVALALALAGVSRRIEGEALAAALKGDFDAEAGAALVSVMRGVADAIQRTLASCGLGALEVRDAREIPQPREDPSWLEAEGYLRVRLRLAGAEPIDGVLDLLFADALNEADEAFEPRTVCFLEADENARRAFDDLSRELGYRAVAVEPSELLPAPAERLLGAVAVVVPFELSGSAGLDWVEVLAADPGLAQVPILVASWRPTRGQLCAALRAGARSLIVQPYEAKEIRRRIELALGPPAEGVAGA